MSFHRNIIRACYNFWLHALLLNFWSNDAISGVGHLLRQEGNETYQAGQSVLVLAKYEVTACTLTTVFGTTFDVKSLKISTRVYKRDPRPDSVQFTIFNRGSSTLRLQRIIPRPQITIRYDSLKIISPEDSTLVRLIYNPIAPDTICGCLNIVLENLSLQPAQSDTARLPYCAVARAPQIRVSKRLIDFGDVSIDGSKVDTLVISNTGDTTLTIRGYGANDLGTVFQLLPPRPTIIPGGRSDTLRIRFASRDAISFNRFFTIHSDSYEPKDTVIAVAVRSRSFDGAGIEIKPNPIQFKTCLGTHDSVSVTMRNIGNASLVVGSIRSANEATFPSPLKEQITLPPGDTRALNFRFMPDKAGEFRSYLHALSNKAGGRDTIYVSGIAQTASFRVAPTQALLKPIDAVVGEVDSAAFFIDNASDCPLLIDDIYVKDKAELFAVSVRKITISPRGQIPVWVRFAPKDTLCHTTHVFVKARYFALPESLTVQGCGRPGAIFMLNDALLDFGKVCIGKSSTREVRVRNDGFKAFAIKAITSKGDGAFTIWPRPPSADSIRIGPKGEHVFMVTYRSMDEGAENAIFEFVTSPASGNKKLDVRGDGIRADLEATPLVLPFGEVEIQRDSIRAIVLKNKSDRSIRIFNIKAVPDDGVFGVSPQTGNLPLPDDSLTLLVTFKPMAIKTYLAELVIDHDADCADDTISLSGTGVPLLGLNILNMSDICRQEAGRDITLIARFTKLGGQISRHTLHYRVGGAAQFDSLAMTPTGDSTSYSATIPGNWVRSKGIEYYFTAVDEKGIRGRSPIAPHVYAVSIHLPNGLSQSIESVGQEINNYRMISIPLILDNADPLEILKNSFGSGPDQTQWRLFDYRNGSLHELVDKNSQNVRQFEPGRAYWLITNQLGKLLLSGAGSTTPAGKVACADSGSYNKYLSMTLEPGWNMIANPFDFPIPQNRLRIIGDTTISLDGKLWSYEGAWKPAPDSLQPWEGYAIKLGESVRIAFDLQNIAPAPFIENDPEDWRIQIIARTGNAEDAYNYLGIHTSASEEWDGHDLFDPPVIGASVNVAFLHLDWVQYPDHYAGDFRPPFADGAVWQFEVKSALHEESTTLELRDIQSIPRHFEVMLYDKNRQILKNLREKRHYIYSELGELLPGRFELIAGTATFVQMRTASVGDGPHEFRLYPNFPNPFNNETILSFSLPEAVPVWLKIFDVMGREVRVLSDGRVWEKGRHYLRWGGRDETGHAVSSGVYILSLRAGEFEMRQRITLIK